MNSIFDLAEPEPYNEDVSRLALIVDGTRYKEIDPRTGRVLAEGDVSEFRHSVRDQKRRRMV